jgi:hypothetical protein
MTDLHGKEGDGWIGVDLDATLSYYTEWKGPTHIGKPIPAMVRRVEKWLRDGKDVRIVTARVAPDNHQSKKVPEVSLAVVRATIRQWLRDNIKGGEKIKIITHKKDKDMAELWDDRVVQVEPNTGRRVDGVKESAVYDSELGRINCRCPSWRTAENCPRPDCPRKQRNRDNNEKRSKNHER